MTSLDQRGAGNLKRNKSLNPFFSYVCGRWAGCADRSRAGQSAWKWGTPDQQLLIKVGRPCAPSLELLPNSCCSRGRNRGQLKGKMMGTKTACYLAEIKMLIFVVF